MTSRKTKINLILLIITIVSCNNEPVDYYPNTQNNKKLTKWIEIEHSAINSSNFKSTSEFNIENNKIVKYSYLSPVVNNYSEYDFIYNNNLLIKKIGYSNNKIDSETSYTYNNSNELIEHNYSQVSSSDYRKWIYSYNANTITIKSFRSYNGIDFNPSENEVQHYTFNEKNLLIKHETISDNNNRTIEFDYDEKDNLKSQLFFFEKGIIDLEIKYAYSDLINPLQKIFINTYGLKEFQILHLHDNIIRNKHSNIRSSIVRLKEINKEKFSIKNSFSNDGLLNKIEVDVSYGFPVERTKHITELFYN